jgi:hypothetical protein
VAQWEYSVQCLEPLHHSIAAEGRREVRGSTVLLQVRVVCWNTNPARGGIVVERMKSLKVEVVHEIHEGGQMVVERR